MLKKISVSIELFAELHCFWYFSERSMRSVFLGVDITLGSQATAMLGVNTYSFWNASLQTILFLLSFNTLEEVRKKEFCFTVLKILGSLHPTSGSQSSVVSKAAWSTKECKTFFLAVPLLYGTAIIRNAACQVGREENWWKSPCPTFLEDTQPPTLHFHLIRHEKGTEKSGWVSALTQESTVGQLISECLLAFPALLWRGESPCGSRGERRRGQLSAGLQQARAEEGHWKIPRQGSKKSPWEPLQENPQVSLPRGKSFTGNWSVIWV